MGGFLGVISDEIDEHLTLNDPPTHTLNFTKMDCFYGNHKELTVQ